MTKKKDPSLTTREALILAWKNRADYKGYDKTKGSSFNSWRAIVYTTKGKLRGFPESWKDYNVFMKEVQGVWERGKIVCRLDTTKPYSKDNAIWSPKGAEATGKLIKFTYNGKTQTLLEWAKELNLNYNGIRQRYFKGKNYTPKEILFGKERKRKNIHEYTFNTRTTKLYCAYRLRNKNKGRECDLDIDFVRNACRQPCFYCGCFEKIGLDRIDNTKGHTKDNVVPCCYDCNCVRNNIFSFEEMIELGKAIKKIKQNRTETQTNLI